VDGLADNEWKTKLTEITTLQGLTVATKFRMSRVNCALLTEVAKVKLASGVGPRSLQSCWTSKANLDFRACGIALNRVRDLFGEAGLCNLAGFGIGGQGRKCVDGIYTNEENMTADCE
jgi:hypothetical protein